MIRQCSWWLLKAFAFVLVLLLLAVCRNKIKDYYQSTWIKDCALLKWNQKQEHHVSRRQVSEWAPCFCCFNATSDTSGESQGKKSQDKNRSRKRREATKKHSCRLLKVRELTLIRKKTEKIKVAKQTKRKIKTTLLHLLPRLNCP